MLEEQIIARKYARALFDIDSNPKRIASLTKELEALHSVLEENKEINEIFQLPALAVKQKVKLILKIADSIGVGKDTRALIDLLARRNRLTILPLIIDSFTASAREAEGVIEVRIKTAVTIQEERADRIRKYEEKYFKKKVKPVFEVDKSILGGFVAEGAWTVLDASTRGQLHRFIDRFS